MGTTTSRRTLAVSLAIVTLLAACGGGGGGGGSNTPSMPTTGAAPTTTGDVNAGSTGGVAPNSGSGTGSASTPSESPTELAAWSTNIESLESSDINALQFIDDRNGYFSGAQEVVENAVSRFTPWLNHTADGGLNWAPLAVPKGVRSVRDLYFQNTQTGWMLASGVFVTDTGTGVFLISSQDQLFQTSDGGQNWAKVAGPWQQIADQLASLTSIQFRTATEAWIGSPYGVFKSTDAGATWALSDSKPAPRDMKFVSTTQGWGLGSSGNANLVYTSVDGGVSWTSTRVGGTTVVGDVTLDVVQSVEVAAFFDTQKAWVSVLPSPAVTTTQTPTLYRTNDSGKSWQPIAGTPSFVGGMQFVTAQHGYGVTRDGSLWESKDSGNTWTQIAAAQANIYGVNKLVLTPSFAWTATDKPPIRDPFSTRAGLSKARLP